MFNIIYQKNLGINATSMITNYIQIVTKDVLPELRSEVFAGEHLRFLAETMYHSSINTSTYSLIYSKYAAITVKAIQLNLLK